MFVKVVIRNNCDKEGLVSGEILLPKALPGHLEIEMFEDLNGSSTECALDLLTDRLYDLNLALATQRMTDRRKTVLDSFYSFLCDLHDLCLDMDKGVLFFE